MNIAFTFKNFEASDHLKKYARRRMEKMGRFFGKASGLEVGVVLTVDKFRHRCEVTIAGEGLHLSASEQSSDMYAAIDLVVDKVEAPDQEARLARQGTAPSGPQRQRGRLHLQPGSRSR